VLHTDVELEIGDLFINRFYSKMHKEQVIQVWLFVKERSLNKYMWKQVPDYVHLAFVGSGCLTV
jgi:hypothetical protein